MDSDTGVRDWGSDAKFMEDHMASTWVFVVLIACMGATVGFTLGWCVFG